MSYNYPVTATLVIDAMTRVIRDYPQYASEANCILKSLVIEIAAENDVALDKVRKDSRILRNKAMGIYIS